MSQDIMYYPSQITPKISMQIKQKQKADELANELRLWMHSNEELSKLKNKYVQAFTKQIRQEKFNLDRAIELMYNLKTNVQKSYNLNNDDHISIHKEHYQMIQKLFLSSVLYSVYDQNRDIQQETMKYISKLDI